MSLRRSLRRSLLLGLTVAAATVPAPSSASAAECDRVASPGPGAAQRLIESVAPGEVGCLREGRYSENVTIRRGGSSDSSRVTIRSYPGERAELFGRLAVNDSANFVTVEGLKLNGAAAPACVSGASCSILPSPTVNGDDVIFQDNEVTNDHTAICFTLGSGSQLAKRVIIRRNRVHDCGRMNPVTNHDHGIYLSAAEDVQILDNAIYDNADRGIQLYPAADRTIVRGNVIDGNGQGVIFSGDGGDTSDDNIVENNVISNSRIRYNVESWFPQGSGTGNVARNNCLFNGRQGNVGEQDGFVAIRNLIVDPLYTDRAGKDFRLKAGSPCAAVLEGAEVPAAPLDPTSVPGGTTTTPTAPTTDSEPTPEKKPKGKPGRVVLENASVKMSTRRGRARVRVAGRVTGDAPQRIKIQVRRGGKWRTIAVVPQVQGTFRIVRRARVAGLSSARRTTVRVVAPGAKSNYVLARTVR